VIVLIGWMGVSPSAWAQQAGPVQLQFASPLFMRLRTNCWTEWPVTVQNNSQAPARARVVLPMPGQARWRIEFQKDLAIPPGTRRTGRLAVRVGTLPAPARGRGNRACRGGQQITQQARLIDIETAEELRRHELPVNGLAETALGVLIATGSDRIEGDSTSFLATLPNTPLGEVTLMSVSAGKLPQRWFGYQEAGLMILGPTRPGDLLPGQWQALQRWVRQGGMVVLAGGETLGPLLDGPLADLAGVRCVGAHPVDSFSVPSLHDKPFRLAQPMPLAHLAVTTAEVLFATDSLPLLTGRQCGRGQVLTLALPIGALKSPKLGEVFSRIASRLKTHSAFEADSFATLGPATLQDIAGRQAPPRAWPMGLLAGLAGVVLLVGLALSVSRRGEWLWLVLLPVALLGTGGLWAWGVSRRDPPRLSHLGLIQDIGGGQLRLEEAFDYYTGPTGQTQTFSSAVAGGTIRPLGGESTDRMTIQAVRDLGGAMALPDVVVRPGSSYGFFVDAVAPGQIVSGRLRYTAEGVTASLRNELPGDIRSAILFANGQSYRLGDIPAGAAIERTVTPADTLGQSEYTAEVMQDTRRNALVAALRPERQFGHTFRREVFLVGYVDGSLIEPVGAESLDRQGFSVVLQDLSVAPGGAGQAVTIPAGFAELAIRNIGSPVYNPYRQEFNPNPRPGAIELRIDPQQDLATAQVELTVDISANNFRMVLGGVAESDDRPRRLPIRTIANPAGRFTIRVDQAERFIAPDGRIVLYLAVEKNPGGVMANQPAGTVTWKISSIQAVVKGTVR